MSVRRASRRDDGPLPTPVLLDVEPGLWRAGIRGRDADEREVRIDGKVFTDMRTAWEVSQAMVAERKKAKRATDSVSGGATT
jgi:hypothetical protein